MNRNFFSMHVYIFGTYHPQNRLEGNMLSSLASTFPWSIGIPNNTLRQFFLWWTALKSNLLFCLNALGTSLPYGWCYAPCFNIVDYLLIYYRRKVRLLSLNHILLSSQIWDRLSLSFYAWSFLNIFPMDNFLPNLITDGLCQIFSQWTFIRHESGFQ